MAPKEKDIFLELIANLFIYGFVKKLKIMCGELDRVKFVGPIEVFDDDILSKKGIHGIYGWCEIETEETAKLGYVQEIGMSIDWKPDQCNLSQVQICKFAGVVEYRIKQILAGNETFFMNDDQWEEISKNLEK